MLSVAGLIAAGLGWLLLMFAVALWAERSPRLLAAHWRHVYALSLAVYCTSWTFFGTVTQAARYGWPLPPTFVGTLLLYLLAAALLVVGGLVGAGMLGGGGAGGDVPVAEVARGGRAAGAGAAGRSGALLGAAPLALVYAVSILPWWDVTDSASGAAHAGWVRFLWLNYAVGFLLTMLVIAAVNGWLPA